MIPKITIHVYTKFLKIHIIILYINKAAIEQADRQIDEKAEKTLSHSLACETFSMHHYLDSVLFIFSSKEYG